ncbi:MAG: HAD-IIB family hydrolase [Erysipelotrichaceae bacterium]|nr:HAD-IIB family hydrolase [Erysipelotrichaceae bacterium]MDD3810569.1 HAD-IIB family hydrolase [Erysipelotrichaceae bacterium]
MNILASDFDGTLYFQETGYRETDIEAILKFQEQGNKFGFCTGRPLMGIIHFLDERLTPDFYILNSGAYILDGDRRCIYKNTIAHSVCEDLVASYTGCSITVFTDEFIYYTVKPKQHDKNGILKPYENLQDDIDILGISLHLDDDKEALDLAKKINGHLKLDAFVNMGSIDCVAKGCSKDTGIKAIADFYGLSEPVACIGDNYNDLPMLEGSELSFTFNSSPDPVKKAASYLVDSLSECVDWLMENKRSK